MIDMAHYHRIKFLKEVEGLSQRQIAQKLGISRNTVSKYLKENKPPTTIRRQTTHGKKEYSDETKRVLPFIDQWCILQGKSTKECNRKYTSLPALI